MLRSSNLCRSIVASRGKHALVGDDYQYLEKSEIPSYHFQKSLRRLPIPKLPDTVNRYLASSKAVLSPDAYSKTEQAIRSFEANEGPKLQEALLEYDKAHRDTSYISEPWFDMYLRARVPVAVNYNPFMMYAPDPDPKFNDQLTRATNLAISYARIKRSLDENLLGPEVFHMNPKKSDTKLFRTVCKTLPPSLSWFGAVAFKAFPLDMSQYKSLFCGSRIPKKEKDVLYLDASQKHFVAFYKGIPYAVRIFDDSGRLLDAEDVHASLAWILKNGKEAAPEESVGSLTSLDRDSWADARIELENAGNGEKLKKIDGGLFAICLDDLKTEEHKRLVQSLLIGDDARNRWFDKCFQTIIDANGQATINFEHSWGDGVAVLRLMEESFKDTNKNHFVSPDDTPKAFNPAHVEALNFKLTDSLKAKISEAQKTHVSCNADLDFATMEFEGLNRDLIKKTKLSPDSVMQLAIQMAFYSLYKEFVPTYESCSTAAFLKGRTECMRSATAATRAATLAILEENRKDVRQLLTDCSAQHFQLVKEASMGQGYDRHLLGLKITAQRLSQPIPDFFHDPGYTRMGHFVLSTSTLSTETIVFGGFGPVVPDGFGIGYNVVASKLGAVISSNKSKRDAASFSAALHKSLDILRGHLLESK
ncbi:CBN-CPT-2 protein [Caenorhabditis brenneri]|uniref:CBN-CPT-2 protein n=1 Tax=Caenorhabditis brenneri TaxID=135651 RepID=G0PB57_CAEBE|nr:CBN-CPT-2 protein [Caenorhabditis brenneri]